MSHVYVTTWDFERKTEHLREIKFFQHYDFITGEVKTVNGIDEGCTGFHDLADVLTLTAGLLSALLTLGHHARLLCCRHTQCQHLSKLNCILSPH